MRSFKLSTILVFSISIIAFAGCGAEGNVSNAKKTSNIKPVPAEDAGWELVFTDNFDRKELGKNWEPVNGKWEIKDGKLHGSGTIVSKRSFPARDETGKIYPGGFALGYIRMEFEATSAVKPFVFFKGKKPDVELGDLSSFINVRHPDKAKGGLFKSGYFFQFGGHYNTKHRITKKGQNISVKENPENFIETDKRHKVIVENDEGHLRMFVDNKLILEHEEIGSIMGSGFDKVGFYFYTAFDVHNVKVYVKKLVGGMDRD